MAIRRLSTIISALAIVAVGVAGCGGSGSNGIESKSTDQIISAARSAAESAKSVHVAGSVTTAGASLTLDLELDSSKGAKGKISEGGLSFELVRIGDTAYINGSPSFYEHFAGREAAKLLKGKWLKAPSNTGSLATLGSLTDTKQLIGSALAAAGKRLKKGSVSTVNGQKAIAVKDTTHGGTLYVATTGKPYPVQIEGGPSSAGKVTFEDWNKPVTLSAPPAQDVIDITKLKSGG